MIHYIVKNWCEWFSSSDSYIESLIGKDNIYIWGSKEDRQLIYKTLESKGMQVSGFIDKNNKIDDCTGLPISKVEEFDSKNRPFLVIAKCSSQTEHILNKLDYYRGKDYLYLDKPEYSLSQIKEFKDAYGNKIFSAKQLDNVTVKVRGYDNRLYIGKNVSFGKECILDLGYHSQIIIGDNCTINDGSEISVWDNALIKIGNRCDFGKHTFLTSDGSLIIGDNNWFGFQCYIACGNSGQIKIGNDCLLSNYIKIRPDNGHAIFDLEKYKNLNELYDKKIIIEDHVWIGLAATILGDTYLDKGIMAGAGCIIKGSYPSNCMIAGNPARITRRNIVWDKNADYNF